MHKKTEKCVMSKSLAIKHMNDRYGETGWTIQRLPGQETYAVWGCCDKGIPRFSSGWISPETDYDKACSDLYNQILRTVNKDPTEWYKAVDQRKFWLTRQ